MNRIAIIDNGVVNGVIKKLDDIPQIDLSDNKRRCSGTEGDEVNHGTVCAGIIKKYAFEAELISIKIMPDDVRSGTIAPLIKAIEFCIDQKIKLINVSLGTCDPIAIIELGKVVKKAIENDTIIVASGKQNKIVYPSAYEGVIHCETNMRYITMDDSCYLKLLPSGERVVIASGKQSLHLRDGKSMVTPNYSSFSTPVVTSVIWRMMREEGPGLSCVNKFFSICNYNDDNKGSFRFV